MDAYLAKPLSLAPLAAVLARWSEKDEDPVPPLKLVPTRDAPADPTGVVLDAAVLDQLDRLGETAGEDLVGQLALQFLAEADAAVVALRQSFVEADLDAVARSAHTLSGASANMGATELARLCANIATDAGAEAFLGDESLIDALESELGRVRSAFSARSAVR